MADGGWGLPGGELHMYSCMCTVPSAWRVHSCSAASRRGDHGHRIRNLTVTGRATHEKDPPRSFAEPCSSCVPLHSLHRARALSLLRARALSLSLISCRIPRCAIRGFRGHVFVYRNIVKALPWMDMVREKAGPYCSTNFIYPQSLVEAPYRRTQAASCGGLGLCVYRVVLVC